MTRPIARLFVAAGLFHAVVAVAPALATVAESQLEALVVGAGAKRIECPEDVSEIAPGEDPLCGRTDPGAKDARKALRKFLDAHDERNRDRPWTRKHEWRLRLALLDGRPYRVAFDTGRDLLAVSPEPICFGEEFPRAEVFRVDSPGLQLPKLVDKVRPTFPVRAREQRTGGTFEAWAWIDRTGHVVDACTIHVLPERMGFEEAAREALDKQRYAPGTVDGTPVPVLMYVWFEWTLGPR